MATVTLSINWLITERGRADVQVVEDYGTGFVTEWVVPSRADADTLVEERKRSITETIEYTIRDMVSITHRASSVICGPRDEVLS